MVTVAIFLISIFNLRRLNLGEIFLKTIQSIRFLFYKGIPKILWIQYFSVVSTIIIFKKKKKLIFWLFNIYTIKSKLSNIIRFQKFRYGRNKKKKKKIYKNWKGFKKVFFLKNKILLICNQNQVLNTFEIN